MTDTDLEQKAALPEQETVLLEAEEDIPAEADAEVQASSVPDEEIPAVPQIVELGNLLSELQAILGPEEQVITKAPEEKKKPSRAKRFWKGFGRFLATTVLRLLLVVFTAVLVAFAGLVLALNLVFNGPSSHARDQLTMSLLEASATKWVPAIFLGEETVAEIRAAAGIELPSEQSNTSLVTINTDSSLAGSADEWADYPDGIRIEEYRGETYTAHIMIIRNPAQVYCGTNTSKFSEEIPGMRLNTKMNRAGAIAGINGGAFNDDGTMSNVIGSLPIGLVVSQGKILWNDGSSYDGFVGFTEDNILVVAKSMSAGKAQELKIRDGCCFGPVLIMDGQVNDKAYSANSGLNPRTCIGQRADGAVVMLCIDGRQANSLGGTYADATDILVEYGCVNACNLDGGSSSIMYYRDTQGRYGEPGELQMINNYSLLQEQPRGMPTFFLVAPAEEPDK